MAASSTATVSTPETSSDDARIKLRKWNAVAMWSFGDGNESLRLTKVQILFAEFCLCLQ